MSRRASVLWHTSGMSIVAMPKERPKDGVDVAQTHLAGGSLTERPNAVVRRDLMHTVGGGVFLSHTFPCLCLHRDDLLKCLMRHLTHR